MERAAAAALALARLRGDGRAWAVATAPADLPDDPIGLWDAAASGTRTLLREADAWHLGDGCAWQACASGPGRTAWLARAQAGLEATCTVQAPPDAGSGPALLLQLAFEEDGPGPGCWGPALPGGRLWLPARLRWRDAAGRGWEQRATPVLAGEDAATVLARLHRPPDPADPGDAVAWPPAPVDYAGLVEDAIGLIADGALRKVVAARAVDVAVASVPDAVLLARLASGAGASATVYAHDLADGSLCCGATPELLLAADGDHLRTMALAATCAAGADGAEELARIAALIDSTKQRKEHGVVVEHLAAVLRPRCAPFAVPPAPHVRHAGPLLHLETLIEADLLRRDYLEAAGALHPTPAVCGLPAGFAAHWLRRHERLQRGLYAGALGWLSPAACRLIVPLRGGVLDRTRRRARLYAGAGIVETSDPRAELAETELKLAPMRTALGLPP